MFKLFALLVGFAMLIVAIGPDLNGPAEIAAGVIPGLNDSLTQNGVVAAPQAGMPDRADAYVLPAFLLLMGAAAMLAAAGCKTAIVATLAVLGGVGCFAAGPEPAGRAVEPLSGGETVFPGHIFVHV